MASTRYNHLFLSNDYWTRQGYTRPPGGGGSPEIPRRSVQEHSQWLRDRLDNAWLQVDSESERPRAISVPTRSGAYLEFLGAPGEYLKTQSLEDLRSGVRLLSVSYPTLDGETEPTTRATVFVPAARRGHFLRKIREYESTPRPSGEPPNRKLIDSIADIRCAVLGSFWQDSHPSPGDLPKWCEVWIRTEAGDEASAESTFRDLLSSLAVEATEASLSFPERAVFQVLATDSALTRMVESSDHIAEFRLIKQTSAFFVDLDNSEQAEWVNDLLGRIDPSPTSDVAVCILDSGVNQGHPLIQAVLDPSSCHAVDARWGTGDHLGHGTLMAGIAAYGDLLGVLESGRLVSLTHRLESSKILPNRGRTPPELYGHVTARGISLAEIQDPNASRVYCMAVATVDDRDAGRPSSWSAEIDALASGAHDGNPRLMILAAGNTEHPDEWGNYPDSFLTNEIHDPGQSWNALTVGAWTQKTRIEDPALTDYTAIAPMGSVSPFSTTSLNWEHRWPSKPDILMEGGNAASDETGFCTEADELSLLSTHYLPQDRLVAPHNMTSAACALASNFAGRLRAQYPEAWPETIRALMVHSSSWTPAMTANFLRDESRSSYENLLSICGYGVPNLERALSSSSDRLTLITQRHIQPFERIDGRSATLDMHLHELPWPAEQLLALGEADVTMRVTLSYFIEPGPGQIGWRDRYRYASHALRFALNSPSETREEMLVRINRQARSEGETPETTSGNERWTIGPNARDRGSIHSDIWEGSAAEVAQSNYICVYPVVGWWRERHHLGKCNKETRYSLVVSLQVSEGIDIFTPVAVQVGTLVPIEVQIDS